jgi:hypothetical protein
VGRLVDKQAIRGYDGTEILLAGGSIVNIRPKFLLQ